jgi:hypothetical protein
MTKANQEAQALEKLESLGGVLSPKGTRVSGMASAPVRVPVLTGRDGTSSSGLTAGTTLV